MRRNGMTTLIAVVLLMSLSACAGVQSVTVSEVSRAICPTPLTAPQALRIADALDSFPPGDDLDFIAGQLERLDDGARICRGLN
jgi:hypothetical protein